MNNLQVIKMFLSRIFLLVLVLNSYTVATNEEYAVDNAGPDTLGNVNVFIVRRERRDVGTITTPPPAAVTTATVAPNGTNPVTPVASASPVEAKPANTTSNASNAVPKANATAVPEAAPTVVSVTLTPLLGANGTGIRHFNSTEPKVSDPISSTDDDSELPDVFVETPERIKAEHHLQNLTIETNGFYNSSFIANEQYVHEYWTNITNLEAKAHPMLSSSHRRATTKNLRFPFPFYGHPIHNVTVATGGFLYIGEQMHNWLAATQYVAPLMANFDTSLTNDSSVKLYDDDDLFAAFWENVTLQEDKTKSFTFAVVLYKNGDIVFAYKYIPIDVQLINDSAHPVKVGISDAFLKDHILFRVRSKTIYEYNRVSFKNYVITNNTIIRLQALPTCLQYENCRDCLNHETLFNCTWCPQIQKCSSGTDLNKQDWERRNCPKTSVTSSSQCPAVTGETIGPENGPADTAYTTDTEGARNTATIIKTVPDEIPSVFNRAKVPQTAQASQAVQPEPQSSSASGVVGALVAVAIIAVLVGWVVYAFKNPHTRSGQLLIKYRPSQWNWRRGEARYTAATIHM